MYVCRYVVVSIFSNTEVLVYKCTDISSFGNTTGPLVNIQTHRPVCKQHADKQLSELNKPKLFLHLKLGE